MTSIGSPQHAKTLFRSSNDDEELNFSHSEFLTEIDAAEENHQNSEPNPKPKSTSGGAHLSQEQQEQLAQERR